MKSEEGGRGKTWDVLSSAATSRVRHSWAEDVAKVDGVKEEASRLGVAEFATIGFRTPVWSNLERAYSRRYHLIYWVDPGLYGHGGEEHHLIVILDLDTGEFIVRPIVASQLTTFPPDLLNITFDNIAEVTAYIRLLLARLGSN